MRKTYKMASDQDDSLQVIDETTLESLFPKLFYVDTPSDISNIIREYELKTVSKFVTYREIKGFGGSLPLSEHIKQSNMKKGHKILWTDGTNATEKIPYDGIPYILLGSKIMDCMYGPDRVKSTASKIGNGPDLKKGGKCKTRGQSRKKDCPAQIHLREVHKFVEYKIPFNSSYNRRVTSKGLRSALILGNHNIGERRIYIALPRLHAHKGHSVGQESEEKFPLDSRVRDRIYELVSEHIFNTDELRARASAFVREVLFKGRKPPPATNRMYFPTPRVVKSYCYKARLKMREQGIEVPLPKPPERSKSTGPRGKRQRGSFTKVTEVGDEGNTAADSLLLDRPIGEEEVNSSLTKTSTGGESAGDNLAGIDSMLLDKGDLNYASTERSHCLSILKHLKDFTEGSNDRETLVEVKGHLLEALNQFQGPLMTDAGATECLAKRRRMQPVEEVANPLADRFIPLRLQKEPNSDRHVLIIEQDNWPPL